MLCSGLPTDTSARAVIFQNYEAALNAECTLNDHQVGLTGMTNQATFKESFILPDEITSSEIIKVFGKGQNPSIQSRKPSTQIKTRQKAELQAAQPDACLCSGQVRTSVFHLPLGSIRFKALPTLMERRSPISSRLFWFGHVAFAEFFDHKWAELLN